MVSVSCIVYNVFVVPHPCFVFTFDLKKTVGAEDPGNGFVDFKNLISSFE